METEVWKPVVGYEGYYSVSNLGSVRNDKRNKLKKTHFNSAKYPRVFLHSNGDRKYYNVHRLVAIAFLDNPSNLPCVNHINGDKFDNRVENLEWVTYSANCIHAFDAGLRSSSKGSNHGRAKLTESNIHCIRALKVAGMKGRYISRLFNVTESAITLILNGKNWSHI